MKIIGIDPGLQFTGVGIVERQGSEWRHRHHEVLVVPKDLSLAEKLFFISEKLKAIYQQVLPSVTVVERAFFAKNADSAFKLGLVRGVCLSLAGEFRSELQEYAPRTIKKAITGDGAADKNCVQLFVQRLLCIQSDFARSDASDALALALYGGWMCDRNQNWTARGIDL